MVPFLSGIKWSHHCLDGSLVADVGFDSTVYEVLKGEDLEFCIQTLCGDSLSILTPLRRKPVFIAILKGMYVFYCTLNYSHFRPRIKHGTTAFAGV